MELSVRQHRCGGEVVGKPEAGQGGRLVAGELAVVDQLVDQVAEFEVGQFGGHLEHRLPR
jgi:hypothetical protein